MGKELKIRRRIRSVKNINQITKAMEMTAASKLRRAQDATLRSRTYAINAREALARLRAGSQASDHALFSAKAASASHLAILFTSDRGLAGAYNSNLMKTLLTLPRAGLKLIVIGQKGAQFVSKLGSQVEVEGVYTNWPPTPTMPDIRPIAATAIELFTSGAVDKVSLLFTNFESTIRQAVTHRTLLPVDPGSVLDSTVIKHMAEQETLFEPSVTAVLNYVVPRLVEVQIYQAALEAAASEQAARMVAMKNASDNAKDLVEDLTLTFNGARQAGITQELAEISAGAQVVS